MQQYRPPLGRAHTNPLIEKEFSMVQVSEQVAVFNKAQLDALLKIAELTAENMEKLADVQFKAAKSAYADSVKTLKQLAAVKDVNELASVTTGAAQPTW